MAGTGKGHDTTPVPESTKAAIRLAAPEVSDAELVKKFDISLSSVKRIRKHSHRKAGERAAVKVEGATAMAQAIKESAPKIHKALIAAMKAAAAAPKSVELTPAQPNPDFSVRIQIGLNESGADAMWAKLTLEQKGSLIQKFLQEMLEQV